MKLQQFGSNQTILHLDGGTEVFFSYQTPVAAHIPGKGYVRTDRKWSVTTSKHIGKYLSGVNAATVSQSELDALIS